MANANGLLGITDRQFLYSTNYVRSIISAAGFNMYDTPAVDRDSTDVFVCYDGLVDGLAPVKSGLHIQIKSSYQKLLKSDAKIHYPLKYKNYMDLRAEHSRDPFILVLVLIPRPINGDTLDWVQCIDNHAVMRYRAYWHSLMGAPPTENETEETVYIPKSNIFNIDSLRTIMNVTVFQGKRTV